MLRSGRRSTGERRNDPLHPKAQLNCTSSVQSLEEPIGLGETDEPLTLGESLAARTQDPSIAATRRLDWGAASGRTGSDRARGLALPDGR